MHESLMMPLVFSSREDDTRLAERRGEDESRPPVMDVASPRQLMLQEQNKWKASRVCAILRYGSHDCFQWAPAAGEAVD